MSDRSEFARFQVCGRLKESPNLRMSKKDEPYLRFCLRVGAGPQNYERNWYMVVFNGPAEEISKTCGEGDLLVVSGDLIWQKNIKTQGWEPTLIGRKFTLVEKAPQNVPGAVAKAQAEADTDQIDF